MTTFQLKISSLVVCFVSLLTGCQREWTCVYSSDNSAWPVDVMAIQDDGYAIAGTTTDSTGEYLSFLLRIENSGAKIWRQEYTGLIVTGMLVLPDNGFLLVGRDTLARKEGAGIMVSASDTGDELWRKSFQVDDGNTEILGIVESAADTVLLLGHSYDAQSARSAWVRKTDCAGNTLWEKQLEGYGELMEGFIATSDGGVLVYASTATAIKLDSDGDIVWCLNNESGSSYNLEKAIQLQSGEYILLMERFSKSPTTKLWVIAEDGTFSQEHSIMDDYIYNASDFILSSTGGYIILGSVYQIASNSLSLNTGMYAVQLDGQFASEWTQDYGSTGDEHGRRLLKTNDGNLLMVGTSTSYSSDGETANIFVVHASESGDASIIVNRY